MCKWICSWFGDNKLSIYFGEDKTKCILYIRDKNLLESNITYNNRIKRYRMKEYLGSCLGAIVSGESMALRSLGKINTK